MSGLTYLDLSSNAFDGFLASEIQNLIHLEVLNLGNNQFVSRIPEEIGNLLNLKRIDLRDNNFYENLPESIANLSHLEDLLLSDNRLSGQIPHIFPALPNLQSLQINNNEFLPSEQLSQVVAILDQMDPGWDLQQASLDFSSCSIQTQIPFTECAALKEIKYALWKQPYDWNRTGTYSLGFVSHRIDNGHIVSLTIDGRDSHVTGAYFSNAIGDLNKLESLEISGENYSGDFTSILSHLNRNLISLKIHDTQIGGRIPNSISGFYRIDYLNLPDNKLNGSIPSEVGEMELYEIDLSGNLLTGEIPVNITQGTHLTSLNLSSNNLEGNIPDELFSSQTLRYVCLNDNQLTGSINPADIDFKDIKVFDVSNNDLSGSIDFTTSFGINLEELILNGNTFSGMIPGALSTKSKLKILRLSSNALDDISALSIQGMVQLQELALDDNLLTGTIPSDLFNSSSLLSLNLSNNQFTGGIPAAVGNAQALEYLNLSNNQLTGILPIELFIPSMKTLLLGDNQFGGELPPQIGNATLLENLDLSHNALEGALPEAISNCANLQDLDVSFNAFLGELPSEGSYTRLNVSHNNFYGQIPEYNWQVYNPATLGIDQFEYLNLDFNHFDTELVSNEFRDWLDIATPGWPSRQTPVPSLFCQAIEDIPVSECTALENIYVDLSGEGWENKTGWLTDSQAANWYGVSVIENHVASLTLANNNLTGKIPSEIEYLEHLHILDFSGNQLNGLIPDRIGNLSNLTSLDLERNNLSGEIPESIVLLSGLITLNIRNNHLITSSVEIDNFIKFYDLDWDVYQTFGGISGTVFSMDGDQPLPVVYVALIDRSEDIVQWQCTSDIGRYNFEIVPDENESYIVTAGGYGESTGNCNSDIDYHTLYLEGTTNFEFAKPYTITIETPDYSGKDFHLSVLEPIVKASKQDDIIEIEGFAPQTLLQIRIYNSGVIDPVLTMDIFTDLSGHAEIDRYEHLTNLTSKMRIEVIDQTNYITKVLVLDPLKISVANYIENKIEGYSNANVQLLIEEPERPSVYIDVSPDIYGRWNVYFDDYELQLNDQVVITATAEDNNGDITYEQISPGMYYSILSAWTNLPDAGEIIIQTDESTSALGLRQIGVQSMSEENGLVIIAASENGEPISMEFVTGTEIELTADPNEGYEFIGWAGDIDDNDNVVQLSLNGDINVTALFSQESKVKPVPLYSPADGAIIRGQPTLKWKKPGYSNGKYWVQISTFSDFSRLALNRVVNSLSLTTSNLKTGEYFWRVRSADTNGSWDNWEEANIQSISLRPLIPPKVTLNNPKSISTNDTTPIFEWQPVESAVGYEIQIDRTSAFHTPLINENLTEVFYSISLDNALSESKYYWRVRAKNQSDEYGAWSSYAIFSVDLTGPNPPKLSAPRQNAVMRGDPTFKWAKAANGGLYYHLQVSTDTTFETLVIDEETAESRNKLSSNFNQNTYYWRVRSQDSAGNWGGWSDYQTLTILKNIPLKPKSLIPAPKSYLYNTSPVEFTWQPSNGAEKYELVVDDQSNFMSPVYSNEGIRSEWIPETHFSMDSTLPVGKYFWHIRGLNSNDEPGPWSSTYYFKIIEPTIPKLRLPKNDSRTSDTTPLFKTFSITGAKNYQFEVCPITGGICLNSDWQQKTTYSVPSQDALPYGSYTWRVKAKDIAGQETNWSASWLFDLTAMNLPAKSTLTSDSTPYFKWGAVPGAIDYQVKVCTDELLSENCYTNPDQKLTYRSRTYLMPSSDTLTAGVYYWRLQYKLASDGAWQQNMPIWSFTVFNSTFPAPRQDELNGVKNKTLTNMPSPLLAWAAVDGADSL